MSDSKADFVKKFSELQNTISVAKEKHNSFGGFNYRDMDSIVSKVKPLLKENGWVSLTSDEIVNVGNFNYIRSTVTITDGDNEISGVGIAREIEKKSKMDESQLTGVATTYARKNAWVAVLNLGEKDSDSIPGEYIDDDQVKNILNLIKEIEKNDTFSMDRFLDFMGAESIEEISHDDYQNAVDSLNEKMEKGKK